MSITFIETAADGNLVSYEAFLSGTKVGEIRIQKDYQATDGLLLYDHFDVHWDRYEIYALKFDEKKCNRHP